MKLYPIMINLEGLQAVVIGGGEVALRKVTDLIERGARVRVIAPDVNDELRRLAGESGHLVIEDREYREGDLLGAGLVYSAANDSSVNREVFTEARSRGLFINSVDDPENCTFFVPSFFTRGDLIIAVSTSGASPATAAKVRREMEGYVDENIEDLLEALKSARELLKREDLFPDLDFTSRGDFLKRIVKDQKLTAKLIENHRGDSLMAFLNSLLIPDHPHD